MSSSHCISTSSVKFSAPLGRALNQTVGGLALLALAVAASAQETIMTTPQPELTAPIQRVEAPPLMSQPSGPGETPFQYGSWSLHPHLDYRYLHATGLAIARGQQVSSEINTFSAGLRVDAGTHWTFDYTPTWTYYSVSSYRDTFDQSASVIGATSYENWKFRISETYLSASPTLIETAQQTKVNNWGTQAGAIYNFSPDLKFDSTVGLNQRKADISANTRDWTTMNWLMATFRAKVDAGIGLGLGYTEIARAPDRSYEQYMGQVRWTITPKLSAAFQGGLDVRHSRASNSQDLRNPLLQASLNYQPFDTTKISLVASRTVSNSYLGNGVTKGSQWSTNLDQRLLGRLFWGVSYSRGETSYTIPSSFGVFDRSDRVRTFTNRLTLQFLRRISSTVFYSTSRNDSNQTGFGFSSNQYGLELSCQF